MEWILRQPWEAAHRLDAGSPAPDPWASVADGQLAARALSGRPDAYGELVRRHQAAVYNVAFRLVGERETALDLAQEAFVRAYNALGAFDPRRPFGPWINRIVTNLALTELARRGRRAVSLDAAPAAGEDTPGAGALADEAAEPERLYLAGEQRRLVRQAILALPPRYRAVIELRHFQDCSYEEIAATLIIPLSDVKSDLFRARRLLRQWLEDHG